MTLEDFVALVRRMRERQRAFFTTRNPAVLAEATALVKQVDAALKQMTEGPDLFDRKAERYPLTEDDPDVVGY